ncbi:mechanosensitive ion channel family protein [Candidatus Omnitrophota bacterium]
MRKIYAIFSLCLIITFFIISFGACVQYCYAAETQISVSSTIPAQPSLKDKMFGRKDLYSKKIVQTGFVITFGYLLIFLFVSMINRRIKDLRVRHVVRKNIIYILNILIFLYIFFIWIQNINSLTIFLSVISAGIALALQEALLCIAGWFLILVRRPFEVGDRIEMNGVKGDVIDIRFIQTSLLEIGNWVDADQSTGRIVTVPNSAVFKKELYNYNRGFEYIWNEINIVVTFESDWNRAKEIMLQHGMKEAEAKEATFKRRINQMTKSYMIHFEKLTPIVYVNIKDSGVQLSLRYLTEAKKRRSTQDELCRAILNEFEQENRINFAYPTYRIVK